MATILAAQNGNFGDTSTWTTGTVPVAGDVVVANGKTITINVNVTCAELRNDTTGGATLGGFFTLLDGLTVTANLYLANPVSSSQFNLLGYASTSGRQSYIIGNVYGNTGGSGYGCHAIYHTGTGSLYITGNLTGGNSQGSSTPTAAAYNLTSGSIIIIGAISGGPGPGTSFGVYNNANGNITINGNVTGNLGAAVYNNSNGTVAITGNVSGNTGNGLTNFANGTCVINGNVTTTSSGNGCGNSGVGSIFIYGNVTGSDSGGGIGASNSSSGTVSISGSSIGGASGVGSSNSSTGTLIVKRAVGGPGATATVGVNSSLANSLTYVQEIEYGDLGQSPTAGPIILTDVSTNVALFYRVGLSKKTLIDSSSISNYVPVASDVRAGVVYNNGNLTGTCQIPSASSVAYGVPVDNTTGTAVLNPNSIYDYLTSNTFASGSIGERIKNAATVSTMGQQITSSLS